MALALIDLLSTWSQEQLRLAEPTLLGIVHSKEQSVATLLRAAVSLALAACRGV